MKKQIPNIITLLNLSAGVTAIVIALQNNKLAIAAMMVVLASFFDFFDGLAARLLRVKSTIGKELDSLADVVSFGVAPAIIIYRFYQQNINFQTNELFGVNFLFLLFPLLYVCFAAYRLAKFNIDTQQSENFRGLPTPAAAFVLISLPFFPFFHYSIISISTVIIALCYLMVSNLPLFSLKFKNLKLKDNLFRYILICLSILLLICFYFKAVPFIILTYMILSIIKFSLSKKLEKKDA